MPGSTFCATITSPPGKAKKPQLVQDDVHPGILEYQAWRWCSAILAFAENGTAASDSATERKLCRILGDGAIAIGACLAMRYCNY